MTDPRKVPADRPELGTVSMRGQAGAQAQLTGTMLGVAMIDRPQRWDQPFDPQTTDAVVDIVLQRPPFSRIDPKNFTAAAPLRGIIRNDTRVMRYRPGDIVVREGDYGNSAFAILSGSVRVVLDAGRTLPAAALGRMQPRRRGILRSVARWWTRNREPEVRSLPSAEDMEGVGSREDRGGNVHIFLQDIPAILQNARTAQLGAGQFFGETAALGRIPRTATVFAETDAELLEIRWQGLRDIMRRDPAIGAHINELYRRHNLERHLLETPMFRHLAHPGAPKECTCRRCKGMRHILEATQFETYGDFDWFASYRKLVEQDAATRLAQEPVIAQEGHYPNGLIMIRSGFARVTRQFGSGHRTVIYLGRGQCYGQDEILHNWQHEAHLPLQHTLRAVGYAAVLLVPTALIERYVLGKDRKRPGIRFDLLPPPIRSITGAHGDPGETTNTDSLLEFMVERRFVNGTQTMVIDLDRCIQCDECVRGCAAAHDNNPRFVRHGPTFGNLMIANACMHCADPVCMIGCPTGAIHRDLAGGEIVINDDTCIGCGTCANSCPYNNIRMVEIRDGRGRFVLDGNTNMPIQKATKCDLCVGQSVAPACQRACPHDALVRIDVSQGIESLSQWVAQ